MQEHLHNKYNAYAIWFFVCEQLNFIVVLSMWFITNKFLKYQAGGPTGSDPVSKMILHNAIFHTVVNIKVSTVKLTVQDSVTGC